MAVAGDGLPCRSRCCCCPRGRPTLVPPRRRPWTRRPPRQTARLPLLPRWAGPLPPTPAHLLIDANGVPYTYTAPPEEPPPSPPPREPSPVEPPPRKGYNCPECGRVFASPLRLQSHRVSHSDLKPFTCGACGKAFKRSSHLSRHRATHRARAGPPHTCPLCPRRFQDAAELAQHMSLH
ncbi:hypothetical protein QTO34_009862 [Cnephaeus nilssonii]|uniref:C2H2-type domain-containing protein n=1 Tax=Cnephaeus nilssonii TaxID=3371016 RepID=A0AA40HE99_CNENI|nr:hypothetical protein QTO34_009862 [Eptesicus nilssonii]